MAVAVTCGEPDQTLSLGNIFSLTDWGNRCQKDCGLRRICKYPNDKERRDGQKALDNRSEEHTSELQSLMSISYAVICWKKKTNNEKQLCTYSEADTPNKKKRKEHA